MRPPKYLKLFIDMPTEWHKLTIRQLRKDLARYYINTEAAISRVRNGEVLRAGLYEYKIEV